MEETHLILIVAAFLTATLSGTIGMGGGILLLAVMAEFFPPMLLIPIHGVVQLASNLSRTVILFPHIRWPIACLFAIGALAGTLVGSQLVINIPKDIFRVGLGIFILVVSFMPKFKNAPEFKGKWVYVGAGAGFLGLFVGATGPLIASFYLREGLRKEALVATKAICQSFVHLFKVGTYAALGFVLGSQLPLVAMMVVAVFAGTYLGKQMLQKMPESLFKLIFRVLIVVLAVRLIGKGLGVW